VHTWTTEIRTHTPVQWHRLEHRGLPAAAGDEVPAKAS